MIHAGRRADRSLRFLTRRGGHRPCITQSSTEENRVLKVVLAQQKGGAAKTTLCVHLAVAAEQAGMKTAIVDTDPQGSASGVWSEAREGVSPPVAFVIAAELHEALEAAESDGYD